MKSSLIRLMKAGVFLALLGSFVHAQDDRIRAAAGDKYVISARAGGVNYIEGKVSVFRKSGRSGYLVKGDMLEVGDRITTSNDAKAEILLNPGSVVRIGGGTVFEFASTSLDDLQIKLKAGSAIFEVIADDEFKVTVIMPRTAVALTRSGVYRLDLQQDGSSKLSVWKGRAYVGAENNTAVKAGRAASITGINAEVAKFDRDNGDELDNWSKARAKELSKINASLQRDAMRNTLLSSFNRRGGWNLYNSFGLWVFDPFSNYWCFMPFGYGWGSPYGYGYGRDLWYFRMPRRIYWEMPPSTTPGGGTPSNPTNPTAAANAERRGRLNLPPFQRIQNGRGDGAATIVNSTVDSGMIDRSTPNNFPSTIQRSVPMSAPSSPTVANPGVISKGQP